MIIGGLQKTSLIDYPDKIAAIVFTQGCNFRCGYCHNPELAEFNESQYPKKQILDFLESRVGKLDAVVVTGGEPTMQKGLIDFLKEIKIMGYLIKLDTNGTNPMLMQKLIDENLINYIAMDIKAPIEKYEQIVRKKIELSFISNSVNSIIASKIGYEFRTTVVKNQLEISDFYKIGELVKGAKKHYIQKFVPTKTIDNEFLSKASFSEEEMLKAKDILSGYVEKVYIR